MSQNFHHDHQHVKSVDITIPVKGFETNGRRVLRALVDSWREASDDAIEFTVMRGGITNMIVRATYHGAPSAEQQVIMRIFGAGSEAIIDRSAELRALNRLHLAGRGARLYGMYSNGIVVECLAGTSLAPSGCVVYAPLIAHELALWHR